MPTCSILSKCLHKSELPIVCCPVQSCSALQHQFIFDGKASSVTIHLTFFPFQPPLKHFHFSRLYFLQNGNTTSEIVSISSNGPLTYDHGQSSTENCIGSTHSTLLCKTPNIHGGVARTEAQEQRNLLILPTS